MPAPIPIRQTVKPPKPGVTVTVLGQTFFFRFDELPETMSGLLQQAIVKKVMEGMVESRPPDLMAAE